MKLRNQCCVALLVIHAGLLQGSPFQAGHIFEEKLWQVQDMTGTPTGEYWYCVDWKWTCWYMQLPKPPKVPEDIHWGSRSCQPKGFSVEGRVEFVTKSESYENRTVTMTLERKAAGDVISGHIVTWRDAIPLAREIKVVPYQLSLSVE